MYVWLETVYAARRTFTGKATNIRAESTFMLHELYISSASSDKIATYSDTFVYFLFF